MKLAKLVFPFPQILPYGLQPSLGSLFGCFLVVDNDKSTIMWQNLHKGYAFPQWGCLKKTDNRQAWGCLILQSGNPVMGSPLEFRMSSLNNKKWWICWEMGGLATLWMCFHTEKSNNIFYQILENTSIVVSFQPNLYSLSSLNLAHPNTSHPPHLHLSAFHCSLSAFKTLSLIGRVFCH
jgi:hypothetical protein